jgi:hypothetical protein
MAAEKRTGVYIGRRITTKRELAHFWHFVDGQKGYKKQLIPAVIGEAWVFTFEDGSIYLKGSNGPQRLPDEDATPNDITKYAAEDAAANQTYQEDKAFEKLKRRQQPFDKAMEPLIRMYSSLDTNHERSAFIQAVKNKLIYRS